jgi:uncharacterized protein
LPLSSRGLGRCVLNAITSVRIRLAVPMDKITFSSTDTTKLCGIWHLPKEKTDKVVILAHGITVDKDEKGIFIDLADELAKKGFAVFRFDFRGHGESTGKSTEMTIQGEIEDLNAAVNLVSEKGYKKVGLLGASFGGGISTLYASENQEKLTCLCLWNPVLNYEHTFLNPTVLWIKEVKDRLKKDFDEKGWSELGSRKFKIGKELFDEMKTFSPYEELKKINIPTCIIHGDCDTKVPFEDSVKYFNNLTGEKEFIKFEGSEHGFHEEPFHSKAITETVKFFEKFL